MQCKKCQTEFERKRETHIFCSKKCRETHWAENNRERLAGNNRDYRKRRYEEEGRWREQGPKAKALIAWMHELKAEPCTDCKQRFPSCCMDFDHIQGDKEYNLGSMFAHHYSRELIEVELTKCELVCSNCHRIRTRDRRTGSGAGVRKESNHGV